MARMNGLAAFAAGFGASYLQAKEKEKERERQDKIDARTEEIYQADKAAREERQASRAAVQEGLAKAKQLQVGAVDEAKIDAAVNANLGADATPEQAQAARSAYRSAIASGGDQSWRNDGGVLDQSRVTTTEADKLRATANAYEAGGLDYADKAADLGAKASALSIQDAKAALLRAPMHEIARLYSHVPDGFDIQDWGNTPDGKFVVRIADKDGNNKFTTFNSEEEFRQRAALAAEKNPDAIMSAMDKMIQRKREDAKDERVQGNADRDFNLRKAGQEHTIAQDEVRNKMEERKFNQSAAQFAVTSGLARDKFNLEKAEAGVAGPGVQATGKPLTVEQKTKSSEIQAARSKIGNLTKEDLAFINSGDVGMNAAVSPRQKQLAEFLDKAKQPDPAHVRVYGTDPHLDRWVAGAPPYKATPVPPPAFRQKGKQYEDPNGNVATWNGTGWE